MTNTKAILRNTVIASVFTGAILSGLAHAENKKGEIAIDKAKKEGTVNLSKDGTWKAGATELPKTPEPARTEKDRREEEQNKGGQVFIRKTF